MKEQKIHDSKEVKTKGKLTRVDDYEERKRDCRLLYFQDAASHEEGNDGCPTFVRAPK